MREPKELVVLVHRAVAASRTALPVKPASSNIAGKRPPIQPACSAPGAVSASTASVSRSIEVGRHQPPPRLGYDHTPGRSGDTDHLRRAACGRGDVLERSVGAAGIELGIAERQRGCVAEDELDRYLAFEPALARGSEQGRAAVQSDDPAAGTDDLGQLGELGPGAAPDVEHAGAASQLEQRERA